MERDGCGCDRNELHRRRDETCQEYIRVQDEQGEREHDGGDPPTSRDRQETDQ